MVLIPKDKSIYPSIKCLFNVAEQNFLLGKSTSFPNNNQDLSFPDFGCRVFGAKLANRL